MKQKTDEQLIERYTGYRDEKALTELIERYIKPVYSFVYRFSQDTASAEDITQETFVKLWRNVRQFQPGKNFRTWLFTIAKNTAVDLLRKKKSQVFSDFENELGENFLEDTIADQSPLPDALAVRSENKLNLENALAKLPANYRVILSLHYGEGFTFEEISEIIGKPLNTAKSQSRRAVLALRKLLA